MAEKPRENPAEVKSPTLWSQLPKAWNDFLRIPTLIALSLLLMAIVLIVLDLRRPAWLAPLGVWLGSNLFTNADSSRQFLGTALGGLMTLTSITITALLIALQQSANKLGIQVTNHFLDRRRNQIVYGVLIGVSIYVAVTYAASRPETNFVYSATVGLALVLLVLYGLILLLWMAVNQMRPIVLIHHIHDQTLQARHRLQQEVLRHTRRESRHPGPVSLPVRLHESGYVTGLNVDLLAAALAGSVQPVEVVVRAVIGEYVAYNNTVAEIRAETEADAARLVEAVRKAITTDVRRDLSCDADYGLYHLEMLAWSSVSTAIDDPEIGVQTLHAVHDIAARWLAAEQLDGEGTPQTGQEALPIVYPDTAWYRLFEVVEALAVVSSESMQHQVYTTALATLCLLFHDLPPALRERAIDVIRRILSAAGDFVLASELDKVLQQTVETLRAYDYHEAAGEVEQAREELAQSVGALKSRATRVPAGGQ